MRGKNNLKKGLRKVVGKKSGTFVCKNHYLHKTDLVQNVYI